MSPIRSEINELGARIDAATPPDRDRAIDGLRALAILGVVVGHWLVMALTVTGDRALAITSPLVALPRFGPVSWVLHLLGVFFLVGGYASALSWRRAMAGGRSYRTWLRARLVRLLRPVAAVVTVLAAALPLLALAGVPAATLRSTVLLVAQPLWFIGVYAATTALTSAAIALHRRLGLTAALLPLLAVAAVDVLRYGPVADVMPTWLGLLAVLPGWSFGYLLGVCWAGGGIDRARAAVLAAGGAVLGLVLVLRFGYPSSVVGVPGAPRNNSHPPSLLVLALAATQSGAAILLRDRIAAFLRRPGPWAAVVLLNLHALTVFCWHQVALIALTLGALTAVPTGLPGLHDAPDGLGWALARIAWFPAYTAVLAVLVVLARRFEVVRR